MEHNKCIAGIYARLSVEKNNQKDNSIENQILLARNWLGRHSEIVEGKCYIDLGYSGRNFQRPGWNRMIQDAGAGRLQCLILKDFSRMGRDYLLVGEYLEKVFPRMGIRVISLGEQYDSLKEMPGSLEGGIRNLLNEWYAKDIGRRVHLVKEQQKQEGNYLGSCAPYGFQIAFCEGKRVLIEEEKSGAVIRKMQELRSRGYTYREIQEWLFKEKIVPPSQYRRWIAKGQKLEQEEIKRWDTKTIKRVIEFAQQRGLLPGSEQFPRFPKQT